MRDHDGHTVNLGPAPAVDHEARIDQMVDRCGRLEFQLAQMKARRAVAGGDDPEAVGP